MFLGFDCLMQAVGIAPPRHDTTGELIHNQNLVFPDDVVMISVHEVVGAKCQNNIVLNLQILRIRQVLQMKITLHLLHALGGQID